MPEICPEIFFKSSMFSVTFKVLHCNVALNHLHVTVSQQILVIKLAYKQRWHSLSPWLLDMQPYTC